MPQSAYTSSEVLAIIAGAGVLITAMGATIVNIIVALKTGQKVEANLTKTQEVSHQVQEVHTLTNSNLAAVKSELKQAITQINNMVSIIADLKSERDKLATKTAFRTPYASPDAPPPTVDIPDEMNSVFKSIDTNTENIDLNTQVLKARSDNKERKK